MNWAKENKFLAGFLAVMVVGVGVLGFLVFSAKGQYDAALASYQENAGELDRLQKLKVAPNQKNLDALAEQKKTVTTEVGKLGQALMAQQIPAEEITPAAFQDKLKDAVNAIVTKASQSSPVVALPEKFFLGFDKYETAPPDEDAAMPLARQLKVIEWVVAKLIESRVAAIKSITRPELPEESGKAKAEEKKPASAKGDKKVAVAKTPFEIVFVADQGNFKGVLNAIVEYKGQFLIPRLVTVANEKPQGPPKAVAGLTPPAPPPTQPGATPVPVSQYIVGEERVEVRLLIEAVDFTEVAAK